MVDISTGGFLISSSFYFLLLLRCAKIVDAKKTKKTS